MVLTNEEFNDILKDFVSIEKEEYYQIPYMRHSLYKEDVVRILRKYLTGGQNDKKIK